MTQFHRTHYAVLLAALLLLSGYDAFAREKEKPRHQDSSATAREGTIQAAPNLLIVKMKPTAAFSAGETSFGVATVDAILKRIGVTRVTAFHRNPSAISKGIPSPEASSLARLFRIHFSDAADPRILAKELSADPSVEYAEPYYLFPLTYTPNDPMLAQQYAISLLKLPEAWDVTKGDSTIVIGDVDTGVDWSHEDLRSSIYINKGEWGTSGELSNNGRDDDNNGKVDDYHGWDFVGAGSAQSPVPDNNPMDGALGHGTNTSSCAAATADNGIGIAGTSYRSKVLPIKVASDNSAGLSEGYDGIIYAADMGCKLINCSWGGTGAYSQALQDVINYAFAKGALVVGSAGNDPIDNDVVPHWPSSYSHVLNVGSVESSGAVSTWATYGASVHVYAPGRAVLMARKGGGYTTADGTSFSSPITAGVAALVMAVHPNWTPDQVAAQLRVTSDAFSTPRQAKRYGRINAFNAVTKNGTLSDIPGIRLKSSSIVTPSGDRLTAPGMTARVEMTLENVLAPTSDAAQATVELDDTTATTTTGIIQLGAISTMGTKTVSFDVKLSNFTISSEKYLPVRLRITDGAYVDFVMTRITVYLDAGWHTALGIGTPLFSSVDVQTNQNIWATLDITQNQVPVQDYCFRTPDGGRSWYFAHGTGFPTGKGVYCIRVTGDNVALVGTGPQNGLAEIYRTLNGGQTWTGTSVALMTPFVNAIHMFDASNGIFIGDPLNGAWGIGRTSDGGRNWTPIATPVPAPTSEAGWNNSCDFIGDIGWFGTNNSKIYKTTDRGVTWVSYTTPSRHSPDISFRDENVGAIRFSTQNNTGTNALAVTTDGGVTWSLVTTLSMTATGSIVMERDGTRLWLLRDGNAYVTRDLGKTWKVDPRPDGFDPISVTDMFTDAGQAYVWAAGYNLYSFVSSRERVTGMTDPPRFPSALAIRGLFPNPAHSASAPIVEFNIPAASQTELAVIDNAGKLVSVIFDATLEAGNHASRLDISALPAGNYHCRITSGGRQVVKNFVVVK
jgi:subtilisin family serine protease/photosystem II stability/assembly factor-like uncharacterized protein